VILIVGGLFFFNQSDTDKVMLAENKEQPKEEQQEADKTDDLEKNLEPADNSSEEPENELPSAETEEELEEELPSVDESETIQSTQKEEIEINEDVKEDAVMDLQVAEATNKTTKDMETPADSEISNERKVTAAESEPSQSTEELAESIQPQIVREEVADEKLTVTETNTDSFMMDDQMGNMYEQTTMQSQDIVVGKEARLEVEPTSMSKASFLLQNLHTSM
jgi:hypothetical protein